RIDTPEDPTWLLPPPSEPVQLSLGALAFPVHVEPRREITGTDSGVGLRVATDDAALRLHLTRAYQHARWPSVSLRGDTDPSAINELMCESGYTALRTGTDPASGWHSPPGDERLTVDLVHRGQEGRLRGHVSCLRAYPTTWIYHQLATLPPSRGQ